MGIKRSLVLAVMLCVIAAPSALGAFITVYGGPAYDQETQSGYLVPHVPGIPGSAAGNGITVGYGVKYTNGTVLGDRAMRWDASGLPAVELGNLGTDVNGATQSSVTAINNIGAASGDAWKYTGGTKLGQRAVRWDAGGTAATELDNLGTDSSGSTNSAGYNLNSTGTVVGYAEKYVAGVDFGPRAVRWDAGGSAATELGNLGTDSNGNSNSVANSINSSGIIVGYANKYFAGGNGSPRAVRWGAGSTAATELGNLGTLNGATSCQSWAINAAGTSVGYAQKFNGNASIGIRAVRWDASGTAATELGNLGSDLKLNTTSYAFALNDAGTSVGYAEKWVIPVGGPSIAVDLGPRAVRWDASGTAATELGNLGTDSGGVTSSYAVAINVGGIIVGNADEYTGGTLVGQRAVLWNTGGVAVDLNSLIDPNSGWTLTEADGISDTNWVTGIGSFDPDGAAGPLPAYDRAFLLDVSSAVPEPSSLCFLSSLTMLLICRRRGRASRIAPPCSRR